MAETYGIGGGRIFVGRRGENNARVITFTRADGRQIMRESRGAFPDMTPEPEPVQEGGEN